MPKGQKHDEQDKRDAVSQFESLGGTPDAAKQTAADFGVKATTIRKWARSLNSKKAPKRKVKRAVKAKKTNQRTIDVVLKLYLKERSAYFEHRNNANELKDELEKMWRESE